MKREQRVRAQVTRDWWALGTPVVSIPPAAAAVGELLLPYALVHAWRHASGWQAVYQAQRVGKKKTPAAGAPKGRDGGAVAGVSNQRTYGDTAPARAQPGRGGR